MQGWQIFIHSLRMVIDNLGAALRISAVLYAVQVVVNTYFNMTFGSQLVSVAAGNQMGVTGGFLMALLLNLLVTIIVSLWIAVAWHRYVLLEETPDAAIPKFEGGLIAAYFWKSFLLGLMVGLISIVLMMVIGPLVGGEGTLWAQALVGIPALYVFYRFCLVLPAAALGESCSFSESFEKTKSAASALVFLAAIAAATAFLVQLPSILNTDPASVVNQIYTHVLGWIVMMGGVSILTTLYGVYYEGRRL